MIEYVKEERLILDECVCVTHGCGVSLQSGVDLTHAHELRLFQEADLHPHRVEDRSRMTLWEKIKNKSMGQPQCHHYAIIQQLLNNLKGQFNS